ncbi:thioredoxin family protein [Candidatus Woesearchaeota archaeon]|nr:thioredoxin family protein [Candidatus Woesearchaeota archaeon]
MIISVYGSGCATCKKLFELTQKAIEEMGTKNKVEYVTGQQGIQKIIELGAMKSPVLSVDGKIAMEGFTPDITKIKDAILKTAKK